MIGSGLWARHLGWEGRVRRPRLRANKRNVMQQLAQRHRCVGKNIAQRVSKAPRRNEVARFLFDVGGDRGSAQDLALAYTRPCHNGRSAPVT